MSGYRCVNYYDLCRLCTASSGTRIHIFSHEGREKGLHQKISECLPIVVNEKDRLPKILCGHCLQQIEAISEFRSLCLSSQAVLESCLNSSTLQNGGKVYIKDANRIKTTPLTIKQESTSADISTQSTDFLSSIIQAVGIQSNDDMTLAAVTENQTQVLPQYTVTLESTPVKPIQIEYKVEETASTTASANSDKQAKQNSLAEFLKMKPNIRVTPISKKKEFVSANSNQQQQQKQQQQQITSLQSTQTSPDTSKIKKSKYNIVLTSPVTTTQQKTVTSAIIPARTSITTAVAPVSISQTAKKTVPLQDVKFLSPNSKCFLPITFKDPNSDQQLVAQIDAKNVVLPTTYQIQMKLQPQIATVDGQPIVQLTPTAIPATISLAPQSVTTRTQNFHQQPKQQIFATTATCGIDASTSTNEEVLFTTTSGTTTHHRQQNLTIQQMQQVTSSQPRQQQQASVQTVQAPVQNTLPKLQITTLPASISTATSISTQQQKQQQQQTYQNITVTSTRKQMSSSGITVQKVNRPNVVRAKIEPDTIKTLKNVLTNTSKQHQKQQQQIQQKHVVQRQQQNQTTATNTIGPVSTAKVSNSQTTTISKPTTANKTATTTDITTASSLLECSVCGKSFKKKEHLAQHMKLHAGLRPFKCTETNCNKAFSRKEHLMRHIVSHTGKKMFSCDLCQKFFSRKDNLNKHKRTHTEQGTGVGQFVCEICKKSFVVKMYYIQHKLMHENNGEMRAKTENDKSKSITLSESGSAADLITVESQQQQKLQTQPQIQVQISNQQQLQQQNISHYTPSGQSQIIQFQIGSPIVSSSDVITSMAVTSASSTTSGQPGTTATVFKTFGAHDSAVLNLPSTISNLVPISSTQFLTTGEIMGHIKLENAKSFSNKKQIEKMVSLMESHPNIARNIIKKTEVTSYWTKFGNELNSLGPPFKTAEKWLKVWTDLKSKTKKKLVENRKEIPATGILNLETCTLPPPRTWS